MACLETKRGRIVMGRMDYFRASNRVRLERRLAALEKDGHLHKDGCNAYTRLT